MHDSIITILLPVYNKKQYVGEAIASIQKQTLQNWRLLILDDGSTDGSSDVCADYSKRDKRIAVIHKSNEGLIKTLNYGLAQTKTPFVARMDADDSCHPTRLEKQLRFLEHSPEVGVCGTFYLKSDGNRTTRFLRPNTPDGIETFLLHDNPIAHGSVVARVEIIKALGGYPGHQSALHVEDYALWTSLAGLTKLANVPDYLYTYRLSVQSVSYQNRELQAHNRDIIAAEYASRMFRGGFLKRFLQPLRVYHSACSNRSEQGKRIGICLLRRSAFVAQRYQCHIDFAWRHLLARKLFRKLRVRRL